MIYLVTHGERNSGINPGHTPEGFEQIRRLRDLVPRNIVLVVVGTGRRFLEVFRMLKPWLRKAPIKYSPFCGSGDSLGEDGRIILADGTLVDLDNYLNITNSAFDAWKFIRGLPEQALLCTGGELVAALGLKSERGQLYELDAVMQTFRKLS